MRSSWTRSGGGTASSVKHCDITCTAGSSNRPCDSTPPEPQSSVVPSYVTPRTAQPTVGFRFKDAPTLHLWIEHFQGSAAGIDLIVMGEIGKALEDAKQVLVPGASPDLHIAGAALRTKRPEPRELVATLWGRRYGETAERAHQVKRLALPGLPRILAEADADRFAVLHG